MEKKEIIASLDYLSKFSIMLPNNILGNDNLLVPTSPDILPFPVKIIENEAYIYGAETKSREEYESGKASYTLITDEILENELFQMQISNLIEKTHEQAIAIGEKDPGFIQYEQEAYDKISRARGKSI